MSRRLERWRGSSESLSRRERREHGDRHGEGWRVSEQSALL